MEKCGLKASNSG